MEVSSTSNLTLDSSGIREVRAWWTGIRIMDNGNGAMGSFEELSRSLRGGDDESIVSHRAAMFLLSQRR